MAEIQNIMQLSYFAIQTYLPYTKVIYKLSEISQNAERINKKQIGVRPVRPVKGASPSRRKSCTKRE